MAGNAQVTLKIVKTLKGKVDVDTLKTTVPISVIQKTVDGSPTPERALSPDLAPGQRYVAGLGRNATGWIVRSDGQNGVQQLNAGEEADQLVEAIKAFPLQVTLLAPVDKVCVDREAEWKAKVKNTGEKDLVIQNARLTSFGTSADLADAGSFQYVKGDVPSAFFMPPGIRPPRVTLPAAPAETRTAPMTVKAGEEVTVSCTYKAVGPTNWKLFGSKAWPLALMVSTTLDFSEASLPDAAPAPRVIRRTAKTDWITVKTYPPPAK